MKFKDSFKRLLYYFVCGLLVLSVFLTFLCVTCEFIKPKKDDLEE